jgi:hypothetical protein
MTTYKVTSEGASHRVIASWPDLPERASHLVAEFEESKLARAAGTVLNAASRFRWRRWLELLEVGISSEDQAGPDPDASGPAEGTTSAKGPSKQSDSPSWLPRLPTAAVLGDAPMSDYLKCRVEALLAPPGQEPETVDPDPGQLAHRIPLGNLRPLTWTDWQSHLRPEEHGQLAAELDEDLSATTGPLVGRARQIAWYLSAELLIDEEHLKLMPEESDGDGYARTRTFQKSLVELLSDLTGLRVESSAVDADPDNEGLLRVHAPGNVVGLWFEPECWYYGWPDPDSENGGPTSWLHAGTLPSDTTIGDLAIFVTESVTEGTWPFAGAPSGERRGLFGGRRAGKDR